MTRKEKSEAKLKEAGIPINPHLPRIESKEETTPQSAMEVAQRAIALCAVALRGEGLERDEVLEFLNSRGLWHAATQNERELLLKEVLGEQEKINAAWRYESLWVLLWALGHVETLAYPSSICDVPKAVGIIIHCPTTSFINGSRLRPLNEIFDEADLIYRYDWAVVDARIKGKNTPADLDPGVVYERHYALNWLIGYMEQKWDEITTDT